MSATKKPSIAEVVDKIGLGAAQLRYIFTGGGVWFADGLELSLISSITVAVGTTFDIGPAARGLLVTTVYIGVFFGNLASGPCGDRFGRRGCILVSYFCIFLFSLASSFAPSYAILMSIRFTVGFSFGFGQPVWNTLATEISPSKSRTLINAGSQSLFTFGEIYCFFLVYMNDPSMTHLDWRLLLRQGAVPSLVFFVIAGFFLLQSPYFSALVGNKEEAQDVLKTMHRDNCIPIPDVSVDFEDVEPVVASEDTGVEYKEVLSGDLLSTTLITGFTCFVMNFVYYGVLYAFPNILPHLAQTGASSLSPAMDLMIGAFWEFPGYALAVLFAMYYARKPVMKLYAGMVGISMILFCIGVHINDSLMWHVSFWSIKVFIDVGYVVVYVYLGEVYPTRVRVTGGAVCIAGGRIGACLAPLGYELLTEWTHSYITFFIVMGALCMTNMPLIDLLPYETFNSTALASQSPSKTYGAMDDPSAQRMLDQTGA